MRRNAGLFVLISVLSGFGSTAMTLAARIWVLDLTGSVSLAALTGLCLYAPTFVSPWLGALVDRVPRRPLVIWTDVALGPVLLSLLAVRAAAGVWLIFVVLLVRGVSYVLSEAGETAILPSALPPSALPASANGAGQTVRRRAARRRLWSARSGWSRWPWPAPAAARWC